MFNNEDQHKIKTEFIAVPFYDMEELKRYPFGTGVRISYIKKPKRKRMKVTLRGITWFILISLCILSVYVHQKELIGMWHIFF